MPACADLMRAAGDEVRAGRLLDEAVLCAEVGRHPDLVHYARLSRAVLIHRRDKRLDTATLLDARGFAARMGIPKLEADACKVMAEQALSTGDLEQASRLAHRSLALSRENSMGLRVTANLVLLGHIAAARKQMGRATQLYRAAAEQGRQQGYFTQVEAAERQRFGLA